jgi:hypothetical protein
MTVLPLGRRKCLPLADGETGAGTGYNTVAMT